MFRLRLPGGLLTAVYFEFNMKYSRLNRKDWKEIFPAMSRVTSRLVSCKSTALLLHIRINIFLQRFDILLQGRMCWSSSALSPWLVSNVSYRLGVAGGYHLDRAIWCWSWCCCNNWSKFGVGGSEWLVVCCWGQQVRYLSGLTLSTQSQWMGNIQTRDQWSGVATFLIKHWLL